MLFFAARGHGGHDLFSRALAPRTGYYPQYHSGDIDALHVSYFRHKYESERAFRTCNLRKSAGFDLVAQGADPLPPAGDAVDFYRMEVVKDGPRVAFAINGLPLFDWQDPSGKVLGGGYVAAELAQLFARLGSSVTMLVRSRLGSKEEPEVSTAL